MLDSQSEVNKCFLISINVRTQQLLLLDIILDLDTLDSQWPPNKSPVGYGVNIYEILNLKLTSPSRFSL